MRNGLVVCAILSVATGIPAHADISFNFNPLASGVTDSGIQTYMNGVLSGLGSVQVTGARTDRTYNGDKHVVGPCVDKSNLVVNCVAGVTPRSVTLGSSDGGVFHPTYYDTFLTNYNSTTIKMAFGGLRIYSLSFDYEIFPDGTCPNAGCSPANWPDFTFKADGATVFQTLAVLPGNPGAPYTHSTHTGWYHLEKAPQFLGESGTWIFPNGVTSLEFVDWPRMIGIDNLSIDTTNRSIAATPEPASFLLVGTLFLVSAGAIRRKLRG